MTQGEGPRSQTEVPREIAFARRGAVCGSQKRFFHPRTHGSQSQDTHEPDTNKRRREREGFTEGNSCPRQTFGDIRQTESETRKEERGRAHGPGRGRAAEPDPFAHPDPPTQRLPDFGFAGLGKRV